MDIQLERLRLDPSEGLSGVTLRLYRCCLFAEWIDGGGKAAHLGAIVTHGGSLNTGGLIKNECLSFVMFISRLCAHCP